MNVSRTERRIAAALRVQIRDGLTLIVQEGDGIESLWLEFYGRYENPTHVKSLAFTLSREELAELCALLQTFLAETIAAPSRELVPA